MNIIDHPFLITIGALVGMILQLVMNRTKDSVQRAIRITLLIFWIVFGLAVILGNALRWQGIGALMAAAGVGLGAGLMLTGVGQALRKNGIKRAGTLILIASILIYGIAAALMGHILSAAVALAMGLAMLITSLPGIPGSVGQLLVGLVLIASGLIIAWATLTTEFIPENIIVAIGMFILGALTWVIGIKALLGKLYAAKEPDVNDVPLRVS